MSTSKECKRLDLTMKRRGSCGSLIARLRITSDVNGTERARHIASGLGVAGLCLAMVSAALPASASSATQGSTVGAAATSSGEPSLLAGYIAAPSGGLVSAGQRFKVPSLKCESGERRAVTVGLGDVLDLDVPRVRAHAVLACPPEGPADYTLAVQACSHSPEPLGTKRGHQVSVALAQSGGTITVTVIDETAGTTISATDSTANCVPAGSIDSVLFGAFPVFAPSLLEVPTFNKVKPTDATLNGDDLTGERVNRETRPGIKTTKIRDEVRGSLSAQSRRSGDSYALKYRDVVHCCLRVTLPSGAL